MLRPELRSVLIWFAGLLCGLIIMGAFHWRWAKIEAIKLKEIGYLAQRSAPSSNLEVREETAAERQAWRASYSNALHEGVLALAGGTKRSSAPFPFCANLYLLTDEICGLELYWVDDKWQAEGVRFYSTGADEELLLDVPLVRREQFREMMREKRGNHNPLVYEMLGATIGSVGTKRLTSTGTWNRTWILTIPRSWLTSPPKIVLCGANGVRSRSVRLLVHPEVLESLAGDEVGGTAAGNAEGD